MEDDFTDGVLRGVGGAQPADRLMSRWPGLKVLVTSGYTEDRVLKARVGEGAVRFLPKPYTVVDLARRVRSVLDVE